MTPRPLTDKALADALLAGLKAEMKNMGNGTTYIYQLAHSKRSVQRRVLDALRGPSKSGPAKLGRPKNILPDEEWLVGVEMWREHMLLSEPPRVKPPTDLEVIRDWLKNTDTRHKSTRPKNGRVTQAEITRIRDACVRAKRNRKKAM